MNAKSLQRIIFLALCTALMTLVALPVFAQSTSSFSATTISEKAQAQNFMPAFAPQHRSILSPSAMRQASPNSPSPMPAGGWMEKPVGGRNYWGFEVGATYNWLQGAQNYGYHTPSNLPAANGDPNPIASQNLLFTNAGSGVGFLLGAALDLALSNDFAFVIKLRYVDDPTASTDSRTKMLDGSATDNDQVTSHYNASLQYADLEALIRYQLSPNSWYLTGGLGFSDLLSNSLTLSQTIDDAGTTGNSYPDAVGLPSGVTSISTGAFALTNTYNTTRLAVKFGVGTFIPLGSGGTVLAPELVADIPLTTLYNSTTINSLTNTTLPNLWHVDLTLGIKFPWGASSEGVMPPQPDQSTDNSSNPDMNADNMVNLRGTVHDKTTGKPVDADMTVIDLSNNKVVATGHTDNGNYTLPVNAPGKYSVTADADGYVFGSTFFEVDKNGRILKGDHDIQITPAAEGRTRLLIFFDFGKDALQSASYPELDRAVRLMKALPAMEVQIAGYTDNVGSEAFNNDLSLRRAKTVRNYLVNHGIEGSRVSAQGFGMADPVATNDTDDGRAQNRRVEFVVVKK